MPDSDDDDATTRRGRLPVPDRIDRDYFLGNFRNRMGGTSAASGDAGQWTRQLDGAAT